MIDNGDYMKYDDLTMTEFKETVNEKTLVILPIGVIEEHGSHLPLSTDSIQVEYLCEKIAQRLDALLLPSLRYGVCTSTRNFPGSISISFKTLRSIITDILNELYRNGIRNAVIISGHAGSTHMAALKMAAEAVVSKLEMKVMVLTDYSVIPKLGEEYMPADDGHAGFAETSRVLAISPNLVKGREKRWETKFPDYVILRHPEKFFPSGVMGGNPEDASAEAGEKINEKLLVVLEGYIRNMLEMDFQ